MADYKELLRRAISALPENNGAARRAVYEKARSALVGQLRAITPPLPARDITQHRLQLEDCIRQVEQEASEAVISLGRDSALAFRPAPRSEAVIAPAPAPAAEPPKAIEVVPAPIEPPAPVETPRPRIFEAPRPAAAITSIEDIIEEAAAVGGSSVSVEPVKTEPAKIAEEAPKPHLQADVRPIPSIVARAEASKSGPSSPLPGASNVRPIETPLKSPSFEPRRDALPFAANSTSEPVRSGGRGELGNQALARQQLIVPLDVVKPVAEDTAEVETALSSVREVEVELAVNDPSEAESAMATAIEVLDREARGESSPALPERSKDAAERGSFAVPPAEPADDDAEEAGDASFAAPRLEPRSGAGLTIFLVVFAILLAGVGGAGFWAWREGYVDLDQMFGQAQPATEVAAAPPQTNVPALAPPAGDAPAANADNPTGPGNTATTAAAEPTGALLQGLEIEDRLEPTPEPVLPEAGQTALPGINSEAKSEERLPGEDTAIAAADPAASVDPAMLAGSQSLLLEASQDGRTGAVPFSGTIAWSEGTDELGLPTLIGKASIPARNLGVELTIRKNADPSLPASHLMEVNFQVSDSFIGGTIAGLPGVLLKNEELVPGTPLVGASARVVGNSFLFALSAAANDTATNTDLLENRKWIDIAVVYGTGRNAIITLEKDDTAQALFQKVFTTWGG